MDGFLFVDKAPGPTSFDVVRQVRRLLGGVKTGHAGTLDPLASGLLICAVGNATRLLPYVPAEPKRYAFGMTFGAETDTLDSEGAVVARGGRVPGGSEVEEILARFSGALSQVPPKFSAVNVGGERAYRLARKKRDFHLAPRTITVFSLALTAFDEAAGDAALDVTCSGGTYVRSLVKDIAGALGTLAYASRIRRLAIGPFTVDNAVPLDTLTADAGRRVMPVRQALAALPAVTVNVEQCGALAMGRNIRLDIADKTVIAYGENGEVAAVLSKGDEGSFHPTKVFVRR